MLSVNPALDAKRALSINTQSKDLISTLPKDLICHILSLLDAESLARVGTSCRALCHWHVISLMQEFSPIICRTLAVFPHWQKQFLPPEGHECMPPRVGDIFNQRQALLACAKAQIENDPPSKPKVDEEVAQFNGEIWESRLLDVLLGYQIAGLETGPAIVKLVKAQPEPHCTKNLKHLFVALIATGQFEEFHTLFNDLSPEQAEDLQLYPGLVRALEEGGYSEALAYQEQAIPYTGRWWEHYLRDATDAELMDEAIFYWTLYSGNQSNLLHFLGQGFAGDIYSSMQTIGSFLPFLKISKTAHPPFPYHREGQSLQVNIIRFMMTGHSSAFFWLMNFTASTIQGMNFDLKDKERRISSYTEDLTAAFHLVDAQTYLSPLKKGNRKGIICKEMCQRGNEEEALQSIRGLSNVVERVECIEGMLCDLKWRRGSVSSGASKRPLLLTPHLITELDAILVASSTAENQTQIKLLRTLILVQAGQVEIHEHLQSQGIEINNELWRRWPIREHYMLIGLVASGQYPQALEMLSREAFGRGRNTHLVELVASKCLQMGNWDDAIQALRPLDIDRFYRPHAQNLRLSLANGCVNRGQLEYANRLIQDVATATGKRGYDFQSHVVQLAHTYARKGHRIQLLKLIDQFGLRGYTPLLIRLLSDKKPIV
ncbi:MAG: hypothetical protein S4CHLAM102_14940 [Chlamydiia bacterium]|nr:hypothetical protein [Chlamydiia bacterium]